SVSPKGNKGLASANGPQARAACSRPHSRALSYRLNAAAISKTGAGWEMSPMKLFQVGFGLRLSWLPNDLAIRQSCLKSFDAVFGHLGSGEEKIVKIRQSSKLRQ